MKNKSVLYLFIFATFLSCSVPLLYSETFAQSVLSCVGGITNATNSKTVEGNSTAIPGQSSNAKDDFYNWKVISGDWKYSSPILKGGAGSNTTHSTQNMIIDPNAMKNISEISTTFKINDTDPKLSSYAYIVYSYKDPENFKIAGIHVENENIFVRFAEIQNGCLTAKPSYIYSGITWQPNTSFNLAIASDNGTQSLRLNGTQLAGKNDMNIDGITGLFYGRVSDIEFYNFSANHPFVISDSQNLMLGDKTLPSNDFIHIYDSSPYKIKQGHISATLPCDEDNNTDVRVLTGTTNQFQVANLQSIDEPSNSDDLCHYGANIQSTIDKPIVDIMIQNNSEEDIEFPSMSSFMVTVTQLIK